MSIQGWEFKTINVALRSPCFHPLTCVRKCPSTLNWSKILNSLHLKIFQHFTICSVTQVINTEREIKAGCEGRNPSGWLNIYEDISKKARMRGKIGTGNQDRLRDIQKGTSAIEVLQHQLILNQAWLPYLWRFLTHSTFKSFSPPLGLAFAPCTFWGYVTHSICTPVPWNMERWSCTASGINPASVFLQCSPQLLSHPRDSFLRVYCKLRENSGIKPLSLKPWWR